jgi:DNA polymerase-1
VGEDNKLRYSLYQLRGDEYGTVRGRFSCANKNLQQVFSVDRQRTAFGYDGKDSSHDLEIFLVRLLMIPQSGTYLSADAKQIEYRLAAHFAGSPKLLNAYSLNPDIDFHQTVQDIITPFKKISRKDTKNVNFGKIYGGGRDTIARTLGLGRSEADQIIEIYDRMFPEFKQLLKRAAKLAEHRGYVKTVLGRRARFGEHLGLPGTFYHKALNYVIQGSAADIMKQKLVELHKERHRTGFVMRQTVHDEVDGDATQPETAAMVHEILNRQSFKVSVPILWEVKTGATWADCA